MSELANVVGADLGHKLPVFFSALLRGSGMQDPSIILSTGTVMIPPIHGVSDCPSCVHDVLAE